MSFSDNLRTQSLEMREHVKETLKTLRARPSFLKEQLTQLSLVEGVPESVSRTLQALAEEYGSDSQVYVDLMTGTAGAVTANLYDALADFTDYLVMSRALRPVSDRVKRRRVFNEKLNLLASSGDWEGYDAHLKDYVSQQGEAASSEGVGESNGES